MPTLRTERAARAMPLILLTACGDSQSALAEESLAETRDLASILAEVVDVPSANAAVPRIEATLAQIRRIDAWIPYVRPPAGSSLTYEQRLRLTEGVWPALADLRTELTRIHQKPELRAIIEPILQVDAAASDPAANSGR